MEIKNFKNFKINENITDRNNLNNENKEKIEIL